MDILRRLPFAVPLCRWRVRLPCLWPEEASLPRSFPNELEAGLDPVLRCAAASGYGATQPPDSCGIK